MTTLMEAKLTGSPRKTTLLSTSKEENKETRLPSKPEPLRSWLLVNLSSTFDPPKPPKVDESESQDKDEDESEEEQDEDEDLEARLELDYQLGEEIKDRLIPRAIDWFTGDAVGFGFPEDFDQDEEFDSESEGDSDGDDDDEPPKENPPECKQQ